MENNFKCFFSYHVNYSNKNISIVYVLWLYDLHICSIKKICMLFGTIACILSVLQYPIEIWTNFCKDSWSNNIITFIHAWNNTCNIYNTFFIGNMFFLKNFVRINIWYVRFIKYVRIIACTVKATYKFRF